MTVDLYFMGNEDIHAYKPPQYISIIDNGLLNRSSTLQIIGNESAYKTWFCITLSNRIAFGDKIFGLQCTPSRVGILQAELTEAEFMERMKLYLAKHPEHDKPDSQVRIRTQVQMKLDRATNVELLKGAVEYFGFEVLIIDNLSRVISGDVVSNYDMGKFCDFMDEIRFKCNCSIILVHHKRQKQVVDGHVVDFGTEEGKGAKVMKDWVRSVVGMTSPTNSNLVRFDFLKCSEARRRMEPIESSFDEKTMDFTGI